MSNSIGVTATTKILVTSDYGAFKFFKSNRVAGHWKKLVDSIHQHDLTRFNPVMVTDLMPDYENPDRKVHYIIDGQNRFKALEHMELPIHFVVVDDYRDGDIIILNTGQANWRLADYVEHHIKEDNDEYKRYKQDAGKFSLIGLTQLYKVRPPREEGMNAKDALYQGHLVWDAEAQARARYVHAVMYALGNSVSLQGVHTFKGVPHLVKAILTMRYHLLQSGKPSMQSLAEISSLDDLIQRNASKIENHSTYGAYLRMLEGIVSARRSKADFNFFQMSGKAKEAELYEAPLFTFELVEEEN